MTEPGSFKSPSWPAIPQEPAPKSVEKLPTDECGHESYPKRVCSVVIWELWRADAGDLQGQERIFRRVGLSDLPAGDIRECLSPAIVNADLAFARTVPGTRGIFACSSSSELLVEAGTCLPLL
jgi:hypothetical protein